MIGNLASLTKCLSKQDFKNAVIYILSPFLLVLVCELCNNQDIGSLRPVGIVLSLALATISVFVMGNLLKKYYIGLIICFVGNFVVSFTNLFVLQARSIPIMFMDILTLGTGIEVMDGYKFSPTRNFYIGAAISAICILTLIVMAVFSRKNKSRIPYKYNLIASGVGIIITSLWIGLVGFSGSFGIILNMWDPVLTYNENGFGPSFVAYAQFSFPDKPDGYDKKQVESKLKEAASEYDSVYGNLENDVRPNVISIMDEAFCDLSVLGQLECTKEHLDYYNTLKNDEGTIEFGKAYVSTFGGGTARTEFEYLTGYSISFKPNTQPYSQYNFDKIKTSVDTMNALGYESIAMHPEKPTNYRRNTVYDAMGFDKFLSIDDFEGYDKFFYRETRVTDEGDFNRMIDEDKNTDTPIYFHNVTMQNHGGFGFPMAESKQVEVDKEYMKYSDFRKYETLISMTDDALKGLFDYYRNSDEPTIICIYGDHQPSLDEELIKSIMDTGVETGESVVSVQEKRYCVPYIIWANYDIMEDALEGLSTINLKGSDVSSPNYLGALTRAYAGLPLSDFDKYLLMLRKRIPVVNSVGYLGDDGVWYDYDVLSEYTEYLDEYERIQYCGMFDNKGMEEYYE